jgi:hypothetical protein
MYEVCGIGVCYRDVDVFPGETPGFVLDCVGAGLSFGDGCPVVIACYYYRTPSEKSIRGSMYPGKHLIGGKAPWEGVVVLISRRER